MSQSQPQIALETIRKKLYISCHEGNLAVLKSIIEGQPTILNLPNEDGNTPLLIALKNNQMLVVQELLQKYFNNVDVNFKNHVNFLD